MLARAFFEIFEFKILGFSKFFQGPSLYSSQQLTFLFNMKVHMKVLNPFDTDSSDDDGGEAFDAWVIRETIRLKAETAERGLG